MSSVDQVAPSRSLGFALALDRTDALAKLDLPIPTRDDRHLTGHINDVAPPGFCVQRGLPF